MEDVTRSLGTTLSVGTGNAVLVGGLTSIGGISLTAETIDTTTLDSAGGYRDFIAGFKDGGEVTLEGYFAPKSDAGQKKLYELFESGEKETIRIEFPKALGVSWEFKGIVVGYGTSADLESAVSFSSSIKVSGKPSLIESTSQFNAEQIKNTKKV